MRQKRDISERFDPFNPYSVCNTGPLGHCATCQRSSYTKNEYNLFYQKLDAEYIFMQQFFSTKAVFSEKTAKNCFGGI